LRGGKGQGLIKVWKEKALTFVVLLKCYDYENAVSYDLLTVKYPQNLRKLENEILPDTFYRLQR
jgi:hypothetical protein